MNGLWCFLLCCLFFGLGIFFTMWYLKRKIKNELENLGMDPVRLLHRNVSTINDIMCYGTEFRDYPSQELPLNNGGYSLELASFLLVLCENVGTMNCTDAPFLLPSSFDSSFTTLRIPRQHPIYGALFYDLPTDTVVLVWSGTSDLKMAEKDAETYPVPYPENISSDDTIKVHRGFLSIYRRTKKQVLDFMHAHPNAKNMLICGNSLGGGVTYVSSFDLLGNSLIDLPTYIYTFGAPRAGNLEFANAFSTYPAIQNKLVANIRVFNTEDLVVTTPPPAPVLHFEHVGDPISFTYGTGSIVGNHIPCYFDHLPSNLFLF